MKAVEEPACLTVGTDVSAKYRGAFCEAKIKTVKRLVKVKVTLKSEGTSQVVHDDQVKGQLRVGSVVEVRTAEGVSSEAVISKLTDASLYTVVFDDGDEKTLRRTSLCLKGERHFAESETLDQLPLTNPEHFGTPVIGKKTNRGRRSSQAVADEENLSSSSSSEDDERVSDELLGKVCSIEIPEPSLVLVVSPDCNEELLVKKDHCLVRSFGDGKFYTVLRKNVTTLSSAVISKPELCNRKGASEAQSFLGSGSVPEVWKMDLTQILESSSDSDDKASEEEQERQEEQKKKKNADPEPEDEADPEERDHFLQQLYKFMEDRGTPINKPPVLGYKDLNLFQLYRLVTQQGGYSSIDSGTVWKQIYTELGIPVLNSAAGYNVKTAYRKYLFGFEEFCRSALITFRTVHHNEPRPPASPTNQRTAPETKPDVTANHRAADQKDSPVANQTAEEAELKDIVKVEAEAESESDSDHEELLPSPRGRRRCVLPLKDELRDARKRMPRQTDQSDRGMRLPDQSERGGRLTDQSERGSEEEDDDEEEEEEEHLLNPSERCDSDPDSDSLAGTRVRVKYGRGKTQKIYEAHIKKTDIDNGESFYLVHYYGWNVRYDEWVKGDRIIWPSEKGKKKRRGKLKNKEELEGEEERPLKEEQPKGPGRRGRPLGSKNKTNGRSAERPGIANGDGTPRRRTRRTSGMFDSDRASNEDSGNSSDDSESEDSMEKKVFPWRHPGEAGLKQDAERSPKAEQEPRGEEDMSESTPPSASSAPSVPQDSPGQSQQRTEPEPGATPERKASPVKRPLMALAPRSEPMVLLHHCLAPDPASDTDSASESDSECEEENEVDNKGDERGESTKPELTKEEPKEERMEETSLKSPERNTSVSSPLRNTPARSPHARSPHARSPHARSPHAHASSKDSSAADKSPLPEPSGNPQSPNAPSPNPMSPNPRTPPKDRNIGEKSPLRDRSTRSPNTRGPHPQSPLCAIRSPLRDRHKAEAEVTRSRRAEKNQEEPTPTPEVKPVQVQNQVQDQVQNEVQNEVQNAVQNEVQDQVQNAVQDHDQVQNEVQVQNPPVSELKTPPSDLVQAENSPKPERLHLESSPQQGESKGEESSEKSDCDNTPLKRKALEHKTPDKKLKTDSDISPKTTAVVLKTKTALIVEEKQQDEEQKVEAAAAGGAGCQRSVVTEADAVSKADTGGSTDTGAAVDPGSSVESLGVDSSVAVEMGVDALVCHEVDLDEPDERDKVSASEQLMLMREGLQLRVPPTTTPTHVIAPPTNHGDHQEETHFTHGDRGQKRVLERPHSPTVKKHKRPSHKRPQHKADKNGAGHSSDSEDQSRVSESHKHCLSPTRRGHKWTLHIDDLEKMSSAERISFLQEKLQEIRKYYLSLKSEVASIDRRRKRLKKKEREVSNTASASSSSDAALSPSSSSPSQSSLAVEVR